MKKWWPGVALAAALLLLGAGGWRVARAGGAAPIASVRLTIHYSRFSPAVVRVAPGQRVRFVIVNTDPIDHEFIVGDQAVQQQEETGTDTVHDGSVPGRISVPAGTTESTVVTFPGARSKVAPALGPLDPEPVGAVGPGSLIFACHLPGHFAYGMRGVIEITP